MKTKTSLWLAFLLCSSLAAQALDLVPLGSNWRYLDNGVDLGTAWQAESYAEPGWKAEKTAPMGHGTFTGYTIVGTAGDVDTNATTGGVQKAVTTYFRRTFEVANPATLAGVTLNLRYDDGGAIYINGTEAARTSNLAANAAYSTLTTSAVGSTPLFASWSVPVELLKTGTNTIAVEVHQSSSGSSDLFFDLSLTAVEVTVLDSSTLTRGPYLQNLTPTSAVVCWRTADYTNSRVRYGTDPNNLNQTVNVATAEVDHQVTLSGLTPNTTYYYSVGTSVNVLAGGTTNHFLVTFPTAGTVKSTRVWVIGDSGTGNGTGTSGAELVRDRYTNYIGSQRADLWLMLGDNAYDAGTDAETTTAIFNTYPDILRNTPLWSTIGNHETDQATTFSTGLPYFVAFNLPTAGQAGGLPSGTERYYSFDYANIHFICLDSMSSSGRVAGSTMLNWLEDDLAATTQRWIVAFFHHPPYTHGSHNSDTEGQLTSVRQLFLPILEAGGVDLVLTGHSHSYERSYLLDGHYGLSGTLTESMKLNGGNGRESGTGAYRKNSAAHEGTVYSVVGSSGKISGGSLDHPAMVFSLNHLGSMVLDVSGDRLDATFVSATASLANTVQDSFTIIKNPIVSLTSAGLAQEQGNAAATLTLAASSSSTSAVSVNATVSGTATSGSDFTALPSPLTLSSGQTSAQFNITPITDDLAEGDETVTVTLNPGTNYQVGSPSVATVTLKDLPLHSWRKTKFAAEANNPVVAADTADPDGDSLINLLEYAYGQEPMSATQSGRPSLVGGNYIGLSFMRAVSAGDLTFTVQVADNPNGPWTNGSTYSGAGSTADTAATTQVSRSGSDVESIVVRDNVPVAGAAQRFIRLEVRRTP